MKNFIIFFLAFSFNVMALECANWNANIENSLQTELAVSAFSFTNKLLDINSKNIIILGSCDKIIVGKPFNDVLQASLAEGASCLTQLGEHSVRDLDILKGIISQQNKPRIFCGKTNESTPFVSSPNVSTASGYSLTNTSDFPAIIINSDQVKTEVELKRLIFHEMLHWLGYKHSESFDLPYLSDYCCFNAIPDDPKQEFKQMACDLIKKRPDIQSSEYLTSLIKLLIKEDRGHVAFISLNQQISKNKSKENLKEVYKVIQGLEGHIRPELKYIYLKALGPLILDDSIKFESDRFNSLISDDPKKQQTLEWYGLLYQAYFSQDTELRDQVLSNFKKTNQAEEFVYQKCPWFKIEERYQVVDNYYYLGMEFEKFLGNNENQRTFKMICQGF